MIRQMHKLRTKQHGLPRTRGDDPRIGRFLITQAGVCPARAGMIRAFFALSPALLRLPRTRGDDPALNNAYAKATEFAPHARG